MLLVNLLQLPTSVRQGSFCLLEQMCLCRCKCNNDLNKCSREHKVWHASGACLFERRKVRAQPQVLAHFSVISVQWCLLRVRLMFSFNIDDVCESEE